MKHTKAHYKDLPKYNGFKWFGYDNGYHLFMKGDNKTGFKEIKLLESDLNNLVNFKLMCDRELSRV